jgi:phage repressor protein C with HTH and peptisase S24 domain
MGLFFSKNLRYLRIHKGLKQEDLAPIIGKKKSVMGSYEQGVAEPSLSNIIVLADFFGVKIEDLVSKDMEGENAHLNNKIKEEKPPLKPPLNTPLSENAPQNKKKEVDDPIENYKKIKQDKSGLPIIVTVDNSGRENITLVDSKAAAGYIERITDIEYYKELPAFSLPSNILKNGTFRAFRVTGDSMAPMIKSGDIVIGNLLIDWVESVKDGRLYIVIARGNTDDIVVKRVINRIAERDHLVLKSDNYAFSSYTVLSTDVLQVFEWKCTMKFDGSNPFFDITQWNQRLENDLLDLTQEVQELKRIYKKD